MWKAPKIVPQKTPESHGANPKWYKPVDAQDPEHKVPPDKIPHPGSRANPKRKGPIVHKEPGTPGADSAENKKALEKFDELFSFILDEVTVKLQALNAGITDVINGKGDKSYNNARAAFNTFLDAINNQDPDAEDNNGSAINFLAVDPVMRTDSKTKNEYIDGAVVYVKWLGGTHSSSSGVAIQHS